MSKTSKSNYKLVKRIIKFISISPDHKIVHAIRKPLPDAVINAICIAALNARKGDVALIPHLKQHFSRHHHNFDRFNDV